MNNRLDYNFDIDTSAKQQLHQTKGAVLWLTGLSGSGKSTIANELEKLAFKHGKLTKIIDGDTLRLGLCADLGFTQVERKESLRRAAHVSKLFCDNATLVICCFIAPQEEQRDMIKRILGDSLHYIYINTSLKVCEARDPKGLYRKARSGKIKNFTGIDSEYEFPKNLELIIKTEDKTPLECAHEIWKYYQQL